MTCPRIDDAASYALRAMPDGEWQDYRAHLVGCTACSDKLDELGFVADALLSGVPQIEAPVAIRGRLMSTVRSEAQLLRAAGPDADRPPAAAARERRFALPSLRLWPATTLACALLALGIAGGGLLIGNIERSPTTPQVASARVSGTLLVVAGMPQAPPGRIYQVWLDRDDGRAPQPTKVMFAVDRNGRAAVPLTDELTGVRAVLVTDEPLGGSLVPTRAPIVAARV